MKISKENIIGIILFLIVMITIFVGGFVVMLGMNDKISKDCLEINNSGIIQYMDAEVNCSILNEIKEVESFGHSFFFLTGGIE